MSGPVPIGVFDSGVGGLAVLSRIHARLPGADTIYFADQAHAPYGSGSPEFIVDRARSITETLASRGAEVIVVACNTATAAAIDTLRAEYNGLTFVGMEPAVKPAAAMTESNVIGVLATEGTLSADRYQTLASEHSDGITIVHRIGEGLAMDVERGAENTSATLAKLEEHAAAFSRAGADVVVLGCTHYSFLARQLWDVSGRQFIVIDPADAVARQVERVAGPLETPDRAAQRTYLSTKAAPDANRFRELMDAELAVSTI